MQKEQQELANLIKGKKVAFIGAGVSHKTLRRGRTARAHGYCNAEHG